VIKLGSIGLHEFDVAPSSSAPAEEEGNADGDDEHGGGDPRSD